MVVLGVTPSQRCAVSVYDEKLGGYFSNIFLNVTVGYWHVLRFHSSHRHHYCHNKSGVAYSKMDL